MELINIQTEGAVFREQVWSLYEEAFPEAEKKPRRFMEELAGQGKMELLALTEEGAFAGLAMNMLAGEKALLDYFAIAPRLRGSGVGSRGIRLLMERFRGKCYVLEIERQDPEAENARERERRKAFYLKNGLKETGVFARVYGTEFELLTLDGILSYREYLEILTEILGKENLRRLAPEQTGPETVEMWK